MSRLFISRLRMPTFRSAIPVGPTPRARRCQRELRWANKVGRCTKVRWSLISWTARPKRASGAALPRKPSKMAQPETPSRTPSELSSQSENPSKRCLSNFRGLSRLHAHHANERNIPHRPPELQIPSITKAFSSSTASNPQLPVKVDSVAKHLDRLDLRCSFMMTELKGRQEMNKVASYILAIIIVLTVSAVAFAQADKPKNEIEVRATVAVPSGEANFSGTSAAGSTIDFNKDMQY